VKLNDNVLIRIELFKYYVCNSTLIDNIATKKAVLVLALVLLSQEIPANIVRKIIWIGNIRKGKSMQINHTPDN
jgi:hypothetical protein